MRPAQRKAYITRIAVGTPLVLFSWWATNHDYALWAQLVPLGVLLLVLFAPLEKLYDKPGSN